MLNNIILIAAIRTIENHCAHIMKKLGVDSSIELVKRTVEKRLVDLQEGQGPRNTTWNLGA